MVKAAQPKNQSHFETGLYLWLVSLSLKSDDWLAITLSKMVYLKGGQITRRRGGKFKRARRPEENKVILWCDISPLRPRENNTDSLVVTNTSHVSGLRRNYNNRNLKQKIVNFEFFRIKNFLEKSIFFNWKYFFPPDELLIRWKILRKERKERRGGVNDN